MEDGEIVSVVPCSSFRKREASWASGEGLKFSVRTDWLAEHA